MAASFGSPAFRSLSDLQQSNVDKERERSRTEPLLAPDSASPQRDPDVGLAALCSQFAKPGKWVEAFLKPGEFTLEHETPEVLRGVVWFRYVLVCCISRPCKAHASSSRGGGVDRYQTSQPAADRGQQHRGLVRIPVRRRYSDFVAMLGELQMVLPGLRLNQRLPPSHGWATAFGRSVFGVGRATSALADPFIERRTQALFELLVTLLSVQSWGFFGLVRGEDPSVAAGEVFNA